MAKLLKLRRGTTSQHGSFTGAEGEVTVDTNKDTLVVHDGSTQSGHTLLREDLSNLPAGTIDNADINASAAISGSKIAPNFANGNIQTTGNISVSDSTGNGNNRIKLGNGEDFQLYHNGTDSAIYDSGTGRLKIYSNGAGVDLRKDDGEEMVIANTDGSVELYHDGSKKLETTSSGITVTGTISSVDNHGLLLGTGQDFRIRHTGSHSEITDEGTGNLRLGSNQTEIRTANLATLSAKFVGAGAVELNHNGTKTFETTSSGAQVTGNLGVSGTVDGRDVSVDGAKLDGIESGATADQTKSDIDGLNINADQVDGLHASSFARSDADDTLSGDITFTNSGQYPVVIGNSSGMNDGRLLLRGATNPYIQFREGNTDKAYIQWHGDGYIRLVNQEDSSQLRIQDDIKFSQNGSTFYSLWHSGNDGSGSGLDADTVDGIQGANFLRSDTGDTASGDITFTGGAGAVFVEAGSDIRINGGTWTGEYTTGIKLQPDGNNSYFQYEGNTYFRNTGGNNRLTLDQSGNLTAVGNVTAYSDARLKTDIHTINDALGICGKLRGVSYKWLENGEAGIGVIAQEVEEVIPSVVLTNVDTDPATGETTEVKSVDYGKIVGVLINAINELKAEVDELKGGK